MKVRLAFALPGALAAVAALAPAPAARAQNLLSSYSLNGNTTASAASIDYRYTRHSRSGSGRGGGYRTTYYYTWDPYVDQLVTNSTPMQLGASESASAAGTFYGPTYAAAAAASAAVTNTPTQATLTVKYSAQTTVTTTLAAHQQVTVTALPNSVFTFTISGYANVSLTTKGNAGGVFRLFGSGVGVLLGPVSGTGGPYTVDTPLSPGTYWVTSSLTYASDHNAQTGTATHPGTTSTTWGFTLTLTPSEGD